MRSHSVSKVSQSWKLPCQKASTQAEHGAPPDRGHEADRASGQQRVLAAAGERQALGSGSMHSSRFLHVDSYEALRKAMAYFHDERFDLDSMAFDPDQRCWSGRFYRRIYDDARTTREHSGVESPECFREYFLLSNVL